MLLNFLSHFDGDSDADPQGGSSKPRPSDVLEQYGRDALRLAEKLADVQADNYRLREERRALKQSLGDVQGKLPAEGTRVLTSEEAALFDAYKALGEPKAIKQAIETATGASTELATLKREKQLAKAAEAAGFKASVLSALAGDLDIQTEAKDGQPLVYVVKDGEKIALTDYAAKEWADFMPALTQAAPHAPDINAGARGGTPPLITDDDRAAARRRYSAAF